PGEPLLANAFPCDWFRVSGSTTCSISCDVKARRRAIAADRLNSSTGPDPVRPSPGVSWRGDEGEGEPFTSSAAFDCCVLSIELIPRLLCVEGFGPSFPHECPHACTRRASDSSPACCVPW